MACFMTTWRPSLLEPYDDCNLYCELCDVERQGDCPVDGHTIRISDADVEEDDPLRALSSLPEGLSIEDSKIASAGLGVIAETDFEKGTLFGPYAGKIVALDSIEAQKSDYCWEIRGPYEALHCVDGLRIASANWMRFVNCANQRDRNNLVAIQYLGQIWFRVTERIVSGSELLVYYGPEFDKKFALDSAQTQYILANDDPPIDNRPTENEDNTVSESTLPEEEVSNSVDQQGRVSPLSPSLLASLALVADAPRHQLRSSTRRRRDFATATITTTTTPVAIPSTSNEFKFQYVVCKLCGLGFSCPLKLNEHTEEIHNNPLFIEECEHCQDRFTTQQRLHRHIRKEHPAEYALMKPMKLIAVKKKKETVDDGERHQCDYCELTYKNRNHLYDHQFIIHNIVPIYSCMECLLKFDFQRDISGHQRTSGHKGIDRKRVPMDEAGKKAGGMSSEERLNPYKCDVCNLGFKRMNVLRGHQWSSHGMSVVYFCQECDEEFGRSFNAIRAHHEQTGHVGKGRKIIRSDGGKSPGNTSTSSRERPIRKAKRKVKRKPIKPIPSQQKPAIRYSLRQKQRPRRFFNSAGLQLAEERRRITFGRFERRRNRILTNIVSEKENPPIAKVSQPDTIPMTNKKDANVNRGQKRKLENCTPDYDDQLDGKRHDQHSGIKRPQVSPNHKLDNDGCSKQPLRQLPSTRKNTIGDAGTTVFKIPSVCLERIIVQSACINSNLSVGSSSRDSKRAVNNDTNGDQPQRNVLTTTKLSRSLAGKVGTRNRDRQNRVPTARYRRGLSGYEYRAIKRRYGSWGRRMKKNRAARQKEGCKASKTKIKIIFGEVGCKQEPLSALEVQQPELNVRRCEISLSGSARNQTRNLSTATSASHQHVERKSETSLSDGNKVLKTKIKLVDSKVRCEQDPLNEPQAQQPELKDSSSEVYFSGSTKNQTQHLATVNASHQHVDRKSEISLRDASHSSNEHWRELERPSAKNEDILPSPANNVSDTRNEFGDSGLKPGTPSLEALVRIAAARQPYVLLKRLNLFDYNSRRSKEYDLPQSSLSLGDQTDETRVERIKECGQLQSTSTLGDQTPETREERIKECSQPQSPHSLGDQMEETREERIKKCDQPSSPLSSAGPTEGTEVVKINGAVKLKRAVVIVQRLSVNAAKGNPIRRSLSKQATTIDGVESCPEGQTSSNDLAPDATLLKRLALGLRPLDTSANLENENLKLKRSPDRERASNSEDTVGKHSPRKSSSIDETNDVGESKTINNFKDFSVHLVPLNMKPGMKDDGCARKGSEDLVGTVEPRGPVSSPESHVKCGTTGEGETRGTLRRLYPVVNLVTNITKTKINSESVDTEIECIESKELKSEKLKSKELERKELERKELESEELESEELESEELESEDLESVGLEEKGTESDETEDEETDGEDTEGNNRLLQDERSKQQTSRQKSPDQPAQPSVVSKLSPAAVQINRRTNGNFSQTLSAKTSGHYLSVHLIPIDMTGDAVARCSEIVSRQNVEQLVDVGEPSCCLLTPPKSRGNDLTKGDCQMAKTLKPLSVHLTPFDSLRNNCKKKRALNDEATVDADPVVASETPLKKGDAVTNDRTISARSALYPFVHLVPLDIKAKLDKSGRSASSIKLYPAVGQLELRVKLSACMAPTVVDR